MRMSHDVRRMAPRRLTPAVLGKRISAARERRDLTQAECAALCGVTQSALAHWERGSWAPSLDSLTKLARALRVETSTLLDEETNAAG